MIKRIFVDIDDTLNTFTVHFLQWLGCPIGSYLDHPTWCGFDMAAAATHFGVPHTRETIFENVPRSVWAECPKATYADWLLETCAYLVGPKNVYLCSAPTDCPECAAGKLEWIQAELPEWVQRQYVLTTAKHLLAGPGTLLIDDAEHNCQAFADHGGDYLLTPRPWNRHSGLIPRTYFAEELCASQPTSAIPPWHFGKRTKRNFIFAT